MTGGFDWAGELAIVDSCGVTTEAQVYFLEYPCTVGCADETACSYIGEAGIDDGSCMFPGDECEEGKGLIDEFCECIVGEDQAAMAMEEMAPAACQSETTCFPSIRTRQVAGFMSLRAWVLGR